MGISHGVLRTDLKAGDHIYTPGAIPVAGYIYTHHGIYVGDDMVIHLTQETSGGSTWSPPDLRACNCPPIRTGVNLSCLDCFTNNGTLCRYEYGTNVLGFLSKLRPGTCTLARSDPPEDVVRTARELLEQGFGKYDLLTNNCEDYALYCKTGLLVNRYDKLGRSGQALFALSVPDAVALSLPLAVLAPSLALVLAGAVAILAIDKYASDVSKRADVVKVPVDDVKAFRMFHSKVAYDVRVRLQVEGRLTKYIRRKTMKTCVQWSHGGKGRSEFVSSDVFAKNMVSNVGINLDDDFDPRYTRPRFRSKKSRKMQAHDCVDDDKGPHKRLRLRLLLLA